MKKNFHFFRAAAGLQRGRALWGAEMGTEGHALYCPTGFNGAAPCGARKSEFLCGVL